MGLYLRPTELEVALVALAERPFTVLAGGTDVFPAQVGKPLPGDILDITKIDGLRGISECADHFRLGATTTWSDLLAAPLPAWFSEPVFYSRPPATNRLSFPTRSRTEGSTRTPIMDGAGTPNLVCAAMARMVQAALTRRTSSTRPST